uniref:Uncharacterized protein n=1 Tax=Leersia perrieri TaxID=77586 RepID=A0A0D9WGW5_9ORYZ
MPSTTERILAVNASIWSNIGFEPNQSESKIQGQEERDQLAKMTIKCAGLFSDKQQKKYHINLKMNPKEAKFVEQESRMGEEMATAAGDRWNWNVVVATKMDKTTIIVSAVAGSLGVLSAVMGFAAEVARTTDCASALGLPVAASIFLLMAQVTVAAGDSCRKSRAVLSTISAVLAFVLFLDTVFGRVYSSKPTAVALGIYAAIFLLIIHVIVAAVNCCSSCCDQSEAKQIVIIVSAVIGSLGLLSAILGFAAEGSRHTSNCTSAIGLGIFAAVFLLIAQAAVSVVGACCGCAKSHRAPSETRGFVGVVCAVGSWVAAVVASVMFLVGAIQGSSCNVSAGLFACAGLLTLLATGLGIASYVILRQLEQGGKAVVIVSAVAGSLGLLSAILGFSAEGTKTTMSQILLVGDECLYPQNPATALGICGAVFLLMAQITISAVGGCCGCCKSRAIPSETKRIIGVVCAVMSWIAAGIAWAMFVIGAAGNSDGGRATWPNCYVLKDGIFAGAAVLALAATAFGVTSYVVLSRQSDKAPAAGAAKPAEQPPLAGIAMGNPQFPAQPPPPSHGPTAL